MSTREKCWGFWVDPEGGKGPSRHDWDVSTNELPETATGQELLAVWKQEARRMFPTRPIEGGVALKHGPPGYVPTAGEPRPADEERPHYHLFKD